MQDKFELTEEVLQRVAGGSKDYEINPPSSMDVYQSNPGLLANPGFGPDVQEHTIY